MTDTIELLERIGGNASLRYAPAEELAGVLEQERASEALTFAVAHGDSSLLCAALGGSPNVAPQIIQAPGFEDDEQEPEEEEGQVGSSAAGRAH